MLFLTESSPALAPDLIFLNLVHLIPNSEKPTVNFLTILFFLKDREKEDRKKQLSLISDG